jgi:hypothetical protein
MMDISGKIVKKCKSAVKSYDALPRPVKQATYFFTALAAVPAVTTAKYINDLTRKVIPPQMCSQLESARCLDETFRSLVKLGKPHPPPFKRKDLMDNLVDEHDARLIYSASHTGAGFAYDWTGAVILYGGVVHIGGVPVPFPLSLWPTLAHDTLNMTVVPYCKEGGKVDKYNQLFRSGIVCFNNLFLKRERESVKRHRKEPSKRKRVTPTQMLGEIQYNWTGYERETHWNPFVEIFRTAQDWHTKMVENGLEGRVATA